MHNILLVAEPFGFGPAGSLMVLREAVQCPMQTWRYLGPDYTEAIVDAGRLDSCVFYDSATGLHATELRRHVDWADIVVCGTDFSAARIASDCKKQVVVVDPLFWYWHEIPPLSRHRLLWLCINFPGVRSRIEALPADQQRGLVLASYGGVLPQQEQKRDPSLLTVNLSGWYNPVVTFDSYPEVVLGALHWALEQTHSAFQRIVIYGNPGCIFRGFGKGDLRLDTLTHSQMQTQIAQSGMFLTTPGINATLEAFRHGTCVAWLPPQNDSQRLQLLEYQKAGLAVDDMDWYTLSGRTYRGPSGEQADEIADMIQCTNGCHRAKAEQALRIGLTRILRLTTRKQAALVDRQAAFLQGLCGEDVLALEQLEQSPQWLGIFED